MVPVRAWPEDAPTRAELDAEAYEDRERLWASRAATSAVRLARDEAEGEGRTHLVEWYEFELERRRVRAEDRR